MKLSGILMSVGMACLMLTARTAEALESNVELSIRDQISFDCATVEFTPDGCVPIEEDKRSFTYLISYNPDYVTLTLRGATFAVSYRCEYRSSTPPTPFRIIRPDGSAYSARRDCTHVDKGDFDQFTIRVNDLDSPYFEEFLIRIWPGANECDAMSRTGSLPPTSEEPLPVRLFYYFGSCKWNQPL